jgi:DNA repair protein RecN (Recombination protein N)
MPEGTFTVAVAPARSVGAAGADTVTFTVQLNPGLDARPLQQVASGGELSRIMLALKVVLAAHDALPSLVFDEVDQGIGGEVAVKVGRALRDVASRRQVLVITHLPQIAACGSHHVVIAKRARGGVATADVTVLDENGRVREIARMLGSGDDAVVRRHAEELLQGRASRASA